MRLADTLFGRPAGGAGAAAVGAGSHAALAHARPDGGEVTPPVVELRQVARVFPSDPPVHALRPSDLVVHDGDYVSIVGPSGSGKSTLLNLLGLLDRPTSGEYLLDGVPTGTASEAQRSALRGGRIGFVFQQFHLLPHRTVLENVMLATLYSGVPRAERRRRALEALDRVHLSHRLDFKPPLLSGGERQRVAVARAVVTQPHVLLADEPTGNLDTTNSAGVMALFDELHRDGLTLVVITHDPGDVDGGDQPCALDPGDARPGVGCGARGARPAAPHAPGLRAPTASACATSCARPPPASTPARAASS